MKPKVSETNRCLYGTKGRLGTLKQVLEEVGFDLKRIYPIPNQTAGVKDNICTVKPVAFASIVTTFYTPTVNSSLGYVMNIFRKLEL